MLHKVTLGPGRQQDNRINNEWKWCWLVRTEQGAEHRTAKNTNTKG